MDYMYLLTQKTRIDLIPLFSSRTFKNEFMVSANMFFCVVVKSSPRSWLVTGYLNGVSLMKHALLTLSEHMGSFPVLSWIRVA